MSTGRIPYRKAPCPECPWRVDTEPGQFTSCRYDLLAKTTGSPGREVPFGSPLFACHKSIEGKDQVCAGWLAAVGHYSIQVRFLVSQGRLPGEALEPGEGWPELHTDYESMRTAKEAEDDDD